MGALPMGRAPRSAALAMNVLPTRASTPIPSVRFRFMMIHPPCLCPCPSTVPRNLQSDDFHADRSSALVLKKHTASESAVPTLLWQKRLRCRDLAIVGFPTRGITREGIVGWV